MSEPRSVVILGGGVAGLATAYRLRATAGDSLRVTLVEASGRLGGKIRTEPFAGRRLDVGAEALLARVPEAVALLHELGLGERLVSPLTDQAFVWARGALRPLPPRMLAGLPGGAGPLVRSGILSVPGLLRAGCDLLVPSGPVREDDSIGALVRRRLGDEAHERLVEPLLGGIHAGDCDQLSVRATAPQLAAAVAGGKGIVRGLRSLAPPVTAGGEAPTFLSLRGGLGELVETLAERLGDVEVVLGASAASLSPADDGRTRVRLAPAEGELIADRVVLALPAPTSASVLEDAAPDAARLLREIEYASVATILLAYPRTALLAALRGSGFLVSRRERATITACTYASAKWPHLGDGEHLVLKASVGRFGEEAALALDDERLVERAHADLVHALGLRSAPVQWRVARFARALPQYRVGHVELVQRVEAELRRRFNRPGGEGSANVMLVGAAYRGVGVASCVRDAERVAATLVRSLASELAAASGVRS